MAKQNAEAIIIRKAALFVGRGVEYLGFAVIDREGEIRKEFRIRRVNRQRFEIDVNGHIARIANQDLLLERITGHNTLEIGEQVGRFWGEYELVLFAGEIHGRKPIGKGGDACKRKAGDKHQSNKLKVFSHTQLPPCFFLASVPSVSTTTGHTVSTVEVGSDWTAEAMT